LFFTVLKAEATIECPPSGGGGGGGPTW
jgi:hypothetical protein